MRIQVQMRARTHTQLLETNKPMSLGEMPSLPEALCVPATSHQWTHLSHRTQRGISEGGISFSSWGLSMVLSFWMMNVKQGSSKYPLKVFGMTWKGLNHRLPRLSVPLTNTPSSLGSVAGKGHHIPNTMPITPGNRQDGRQLWSGKKMWRKDWHVE